MDKVYLTYQKNSNNIISFDGSQQTGPLLEGLTHTYIYKYNSIGFSQLIYSLALSNKLYKICKVNSY